MGSRNIDVRPGAVALIVLALSVAAACSDSTTSPPVIDPGPSTAVDVPFCAGLEPNWVAFQDGDGAWTQAQPIVTGQRVSFHHEFAANRGAVATARVFAHGLTALSIQYGAPAELAIVGDTVPVHCGPELSKTLLGSVAGLGDNELATINASFNARDNVAPPSTDFQLSNLPAGPQDILATRTTRVPGSDVVTRVIFRRNLDLPDGATLPVIDFNSTEAFAPVLASVTVGGMGPEGASVNTLLRTPNSQAIWSIGTRATNAPATRAYLGIPENKLQSADLQILIAQANPTTAAEIRSASVYFRSPGDRTITLGAPVTAPTLSTVATAPALRLRARFGPQAEYDRQTAVSFQQGDNTIVAVAMTATYASLAGAGYDLVVPDLSAATGFDPAWALRPGVSVFYIVNRTGGTLGLGQNAVPTDGSTTRTGIVFGEFQPQ